MNCFQKPQAHQSRNASYNSRRQVVCTLGPKSRDVPVLEKLLRAGMSMARFNFSHGTQQYHQVMEEDQSYQGRDESCLIVEGGGWKSIPKQVGKFSAGNLGQPPYSDVQHQDHVRCNA